MFTTKCFASNGLVPCRNAIILVLSNGFSIGCILSVFLHLVLPFDAVDAVDAGSASALPTTVHPSSPDQITQQKVSPDCLTLMLAADVQFLQYAIVVPLSFPSGVHPSPSNKLPRKRCTWTSRRSPLHQICSPCIVMPLSFPPLFTLPLLVRLRSKRSA